MEPSTIYRAVMGTLVVVFLSIIGQLVMTALFAQEAVKTKDGDFCRVKCTLATLLYLSVASLMGWLLASQGIPK